MTIVEKLHGTWAEGESRYILLIEKVATTVYLNFIATPPSPKAGSSNPFPHVLVIFEHINIGT